MGKNKLGLVNTFLASLVVVASLFCWCGQARADQDGDYIYSVIAGEAEITGYKGAGGNVIIPSALGGYPVTSIERYGFARCSSMTSVSIPKTVKSIGDPIFDDCNNLTYISVADDNMYFSDIKGVLYNKEGTILLACPGGLTSINIPHGVTSIGDYAFRYCCGLTSINIPEGVTKIGKEVFGGDYNLTSITIPQTVTSIDGGAFLGCQSLTSISIPDGVTVINNNTFCNCMALQSFSVPKGVTSIGWGAFENCTSLKTITFNSGTTTILDSEFTIQWSTKIIGYDPSTAKDYATKYNRPFIKIGSASSSVPITSISLPALEAIDNGEPVTLQYTVGPANATYKNIKWTTSDPSVASVYNGVVYPHSVGTATITAQAIYGSATAQCQVIVFSALNDEDAIVIREAALATLTDDDSLNDVNWIGQRVKYVLANDPGLNKTMFTVPETFSDKTVTWKDLYLNNDSRVNIGDLEIIETSMNTPFYTWDAIMDAVAYKDTNGDIIIVYAGTSRAYNDADIWEATGILLYNGTLTKEFDYALGFYNYVKDANPGVKITLVGHSLGGALAAYVSIIEGGVKADCFNDAAGHSILHAYADQPEKIRAFSGANVTGYTSYLNTDTDTKNNLVTQYKDRRNHYEYGSNNYSHPANDWWYHELAAILSYKNTNFGLYYKRDHTIVPTIRAAQVGLGLVLGTDGNNTLNTAGNSGTQVVYTGNGTDTVYGRSLWGDTIVASGTGSKSLYGRGGSDTYIIDISQIDSKITIDDPSGWNDAILLKNVIDDQDTANINEYTIQQTGDYYYINFGNNRSIYVKKHRDWTQPAIHLKDNNGHSTDFKTDSGQMVSVNGPAINAPTIQLLKATEIETADIDQTGVTLKSLRLTGNVVVKVYDQLGSLLGEYNDSGNDVQTADFGYFYPVNADGQQYMDIDLINGNYILKVTSPGSVDFVVYDPDSGGVIKYEKNGIDLSDGSILVIDTNFIDTENKFKLENGQNVSPITASEYVAAQQVTLDQNNIYLKTGGSQLINATLTPQNVMNSTVSWSIFQPAENTTVAGVGVNDDGSATITGISAGSATLRATALDGSGIYVDIPVTVTQDEAPSHTAVDAEGESYSSGSWTQSQSVTITPELPDGYNQICIFDGYNWTYSNSLIITDGGQRDVLYFAENSNTGEYTAMGSLQVNSDHDSPKIEGVDPEYQYYIDRLVRVLDDGLLNSVSVNGTSFTEDEVASGKWFADPGTYSIYACDVTGRETVVDFEIKSIPEPGTITINDLQTIQLIREEFEAIKYDLPTDRIDILEQEIAAVETALTNILDIPVLVSIGITSPANKLVYTVGDALDLTGMVVTGSYSDDSTAVLPITAANVTGFNSSTPVPSQTLTVTADGMTVTYTVIIVALTGYTLSGQVLVEGDDLTEGQTHYSGGATIDLKQGVEIKYSTISSEAEDLTSNGSFSLTGIAAGDYTVVISKAGYLTRSFALTINSDLTLSTTSNQYLNRIYLLAGDIVSDEYNVIAAADVNYILSKFNSNSTQAGFDPQVDIVKDQYNVISAADVNLMLSNFNKNSTQYPADIVY